MSFEADITEIRKLAEAAPKFDPALPKDLEVRRGPRGTKDFCPHCGQDLRTGLGLYASRVEYHTVPMEYGDGVWEENFDGDSYNDSDTDGYRCGKCDRTLERGKDFDVKE